MIAARKLSSAMSAAKAIGDHLRDWICGTNDRSDWVSMAVHSTGSGYPSVPDDLFFSFPVTCTNGNWKIIPSLSVDEATEAGIERSAAELLAERTEALVFLQQEGTGIIE